jgi:hypothetical protein
MKALLRYLKRREFRQYGFHAVEKHMIGTVHPYIIEAAIATHKASYDRHLRWFGEGMQKAYDKYKDEAWESVPTF